MSGNVKSAVTRVNDSGTHAKPMIGSSFRQHAKGACITREGRGSAIGDPGFPDDRTSKVVHEAIAKFGAAFKRTSFTN